MVSLGPVLRRLLPPGHGKVLLARPEGVSNKRCMLSLPPGVETFRDPSSDCMGCGDVTGSFQDP